MAGLEEPNTTVNALAPSYLLIGLCKVTNGSKTCIPNSFCSYYSKVNLAARYVLRDDKECIEGRSMYASRYAAHFVPADTAHI